MLNGLANLANSTEGNVRNSIDPYFLCRQTLCNGIEICQDRYMSMRRLSNRGPRVFVCHVCFGLGHQTQAVLGISGPVFYGFSVQDNKVYTFKRLISRNLCKHHRNTALWQIKFS